MFEVQMIFKDDNILFQPSQEEIMVLLRHNSDEIIETVNQVPRILYMKRFKIHLENVDRYIIQGDGVYNETRSDIELMLRTDFDRAVKYGQIFDGLKVWYAFSKSWKGEEYQIHRHSLQKFTDDISRVNNSLNELHRMSVSQEIGILFVDSRNLKMTLQPVMTQIMEQIKSSIVISLRDKCATLTSEFANRIKSLKDRPSKLKHFAQFLHNLNSVKSASRSLLTESEEVETMVDLALRNRVTIGSTDSVRVDQLKEIRQEFLNSIESAEEYRESNIVYQTEVLDKQVTQVNGELLSMLTTLRSNFANPTYAASSVLDNLETLRDNISTIKKKTETYSEYQKLFNNHKSREWNNLMDVQKQLSLRTDLWRCHESMSKSMEGWFATSVEKVSIAEVERDLQDFSITVERLISDCGIDDPVAHHLDEQVKTWQARVPLIVALSNPHLKQYHWDELFKLINVTKDLSGAGTIGFTVSILDSLGAFKDKDIVEGWSRRASGEFELLTILDRIENEWHDLDLVLKNYRDATDMFVLGTGGITY